MHDDVNVLLVLLVAWVAVPSTATGLMNPGAGKSSARSSYARWLTCSEIGCQTNGLKKYSRLARQRRNISISF